MATFVLVHGAWGGGWHWGRVARRLRGAGHEVFAPTLIGLGERAHLLRPDIDLETHIRDVLGVVEYERLDGFTLVGHSYGGMVITGGADRLWRRVAALIYLDAALPRDGHAMVDFILPERRAAILAATEARGEGWKVPPIPAATWGIEDKADAEWFDELSGFHPLATLTQPIRLAGDHPRVPRKTYILASRYDPSPFHRFAAWTRTQADWTTAEIPCHHYAMISMPEETAALLIAHGG